MSEPQPTIAFFRSLRTIGPALIVASVVLGPGSILISSRVGCQYGYSMLWVLVLAAVLMIGMTALAARVGIAAENTLCGELATRIGRPFAVLIGVLFFLVISAFQVSNNIAVVTSIESVLSPQTITQPTVAETPTAAGAPKVANATHETPTEAVPRSWLITSLILFNALIITMMFKLKSLYKPLERLMKCLLFVMVIAFGVNLAFAGPSLTGILAGLLPSVTSEAASGFWPVRDPAGNIVDPLWAIQGLVATTFSVAGAFYQGYLVREKGWSVLQARQGLIDSIVGISVLAVCSGMIISTAAATLHGNIAPSQLRSAADVAHQLQPLFGNAAVTLFGIGIFTACFNPFLINAMIGGLLLSDGLNLGGTIDSKWARRMTVAAMLCGMVVAIYATARGESAVGAMILAQALTVLGVPLMAFSLLFLATRPDIRARVPIPQWIIALASIGFFVTLVLAIRTAWRIYLTFGGNG
jgi:Mn2+/Fe2+ NRAMP family transporter